MRRLNILVAVCLLFFSCTNAEIEESYGVALDVTMPETIYAAIDGDNSRIELNEQLQTVWSAGDEVSVFYRSNANNRYAYTGASGEKSGELLRKTNTSGSQTIADIVSLYPYNASYTLNVTAATVDVTLPTEQYYRNGSYGLGDNLMAYVGDSDNFYYKSLCGWLRIQLSGAKSVSRIALRGNNNELLAGKATLDYKSMQMTLKGSTSDKSLKTLTLNCNQGVRLNATTATDFYFVVAPQTFEKGITIDVTFDDGSTITKSTSKSITISRNYIQPMATIDTIGESIDMHSMPIVTTYPSYIYSDETEDIVILVNGNGTAIDGYTGDMYAHTGVITGNSTSYNDWQYTKAAWSTNIEECKLINRGNNIWQFTIKGGIRSFYGIGGDEEILSLAFVFRSADGRTELKDNGKDIILAVRDREAELQAFITTSPSQFDEDTTQDIVITINTADTSMDGYSGEMYAHTGVLTNKSTNTSEWKYVKSNWGQNIESCRLTKIGNNRWQYVIKGGPRAFYGVPASESIEYIAFVFRSADCSKELKDMGNDILIYVKNDLTRRPLGATRGVTVNGNSATFVLYAPGKSKVHLLGDFNDYSTTATPMAKDGNYFWVTVDGLQLGKEYSYQYCVDGSIRIGDPYAEKVLDPWNDQWISSSVYPNLMSYPSGAQDMVSVFETSPQPYKWEVPNFSRPDKNTLAIYELNLRDFTDEGSIRSAMEKLDYLDNLGINAIELMPIQEFDGNDSWGYNPCFYFAPDKAYGTKKDVQRFIDECHKRGIAVILDVVLNHATGQFPYAKMWWDGSKNCTSSSNPFFNVSATHNFSVYHDFNHTKEHTRDYFRHMLKFWLTEYNVDGFRFDLSKGLVQNPSNYDASGYSSERIGIISDYANAIKSVESDAYIILEHFCDQSEEDELYNRLGAMCWNNSQLNGYMETVMGYTGNNKSDFSNFKSGRINNIETHDEERIAYKAVTYGQSWMKNDWSKISKRLQAAYALHFLTPYPKMMWQFGELGYDISINANCYGDIYDGEDHRTDRKPVRWDYLNDTNRKALYDVLSKIISFRTSRKDIYAQNNITVHAWRVGDDSFGGKHLVLDKVIAVANFSNSHVSFNISVPKTGTWTNLMTGAKVTLGSTYNVSLGESDYIILVRD